MAVIQNYLTSVLILRYQDWLTPGVVPNIQKKTLNCIKPDVSYADLCEVATALFSLTKCSLIDVQVRCNMKMLEREWLK